MDDAASPVSVVGIDAGRSSASRPNPLNHDRQVSVGLGPAQAHDTLVASRQQLKAARIEIDALRERVSLLQEEVAILGKAAETAQVLAYRDELTGLPNRRLLTDRFHQAAAQCERQHKQIALLFLDLDGFKHINDRFGHAAGDSLLQQIALRLGSCIRMSDTACRYGGDEFVILLPEIESRQAAAAVAGKIRDHLALPYAVAGSLITLTTSIGLAIYPVDAKRYVDLMRASDRRMYRSKPGGRAAFAPIERQRSQIESL